MGLKIGALAAVALAAGSAQAADAPRSMFCVAVRTVPMLDQNNYNMGGLGSVYMTRSFTTDLADKDLIPMWTRYIVAKHPPSYPGNPVDTCYPANTRRELLAAQHGNIKNLSVNWNPAAGGK